MVIRKRQRFGAAAASEVHPMRRVTGAEGRIGETARVAGVAGSFETVDHDNFAARVFFRALGMDQDFDVRLRFIDYGLDGPASGAVGSAPKIAGHGGEVGV